MNLREYAFRLLGRREYSVADFKRKLEERALKQVLAEGESVENVLEEFLGKDFVSDERFARNFVRDQIQKGSGSRKILEKAFKYGIPTGILMAVMKELYLGEDEAKNIQRFHEKKRDLIIKKDPDIHPLKLKSKIFRFLLGKGFAADAIEKFLE